MGVAILAGEIALARWLASKLRARGEPTWPAWRHLGQSSLTWLAVILIVVAISPTAAEPLIAVVFVVAVVFLVVLLVRGVRGLPEFAREVRQIGNPDAWRGGRTKS